MSHDGTRETAPIARGDASSEDLRGAGTLSPRAVGRLIAVMVLPSVPVVFGFGSRLVPSENVTTFRILVLLTIPVALFSLVAPWDRWPRAAILSVAVTYLGFLAMAIYLGETAEVFALFFVFIFVFAGVGQPRGTCLALAPLAAAAYVIPILLRGGTGAELVLGALYIPISVTVGEALSWITMRLQRAEQRLHRLDQLRNEFIAMVAHDMRTPMTVITGFASVLDEGYEELTAEQRKSFLSSISSNTMRVSDFVENLLQFARMEAGEFSHVSEPVDIGPLVEHVANDFAAARKVEGLTTVIESGLPPVRADEGRVAQVLGNLISNAAKFSPPGEPIMLEAGSTDGEVKVSVADRGPGIAPDDIGKLFRKFGTLEDHKSHEGTGLGLYISKQLVEAMGGRIWVDSVPGHGATFSFTLPVARPSIASEGEADPVSSRRSVDRKATA